MLPSGSRSAAVRRQRQWAQLSATRIGRTREGNGPFEAQCGAVVRKAVGQSEAQLSALFDVLSRKLCDSVAGSCAYSLQVKRSTPCLRCTHARAHARMVALVRALQAVKGIAATYRLTGKPLPTRASAFLDKVFEPWQTLIVPHAQAVLPCLPSHAGRACTETPCMPFPPPGAAGWGHLPLPQLRCGQGCNHGAGRNPQALARA